MTFKEPPNRGATQKVNNKVIPISKKPQRKSPKAPRHLRAPTRRWFEQICADYELESHHLMLLTLAAEAWDRHVAAREVLTDEGMTFIDKFENIKPRPEIMVERDCRNAFARMLRELRLEAPPPEAPRPPGLRR
jgi:phage terminase small subunit